MGFHERIHDLENLAKHFDEPIHDLENLAEHSLICDYIRHNVPVLLNYVGIVRFQVKPKKIK